MSIYGIGTMDYRAAATRYQAAAFDYRTAARNGINQTEKKVSGKNFAGEMGNVQKSQMPGGAFVLHYFDNEEGERSISAACGTDYSVTVYEPKDFDAANPVYKVKLWDKEGNVTERMVDIKSVDPGNSDFLDMYAYSCYADEKGGCKTALSSFMGAGQSAYGTEGCTYENLFAQKDWIGAVRDMMQMQYDAKNMQGYLDYKRFLDYLEDSKKA
ncbi:MAG: hypothetical protein NC419_06610 [Muribaculaceae bacterium]|nr:hypothetical protein [Muribaculaceae bacterium]